MAILSFKEVWSERTADIRPTLNVNDVAAQNSYGVVNYKRCWRVTTSTTLDGPGTVLAYPGMPTIFDPYVESNGLPDPTALCKNVQIKQEQDDPQTWMILAEYSTDLLPNPLLRPVEYEFGFAPYQRAIMYDINNNAILNSASDPFDPPPTIDDSRPVLRITRNEPPPQDASVAITYQDAINSDVWLGAQPGQAKIKKIAFRRQYDSLIPYVKAEYEIEFRREGWQLRLVNLGFNQLDANNKKTKIFDPIDGSPLANPSLLDNAGHVINPGGQAVILGFDVYQSLPFQALLPFG